jgi:hypothetical protein
MGDRYEESWDVNAVQRLQGYLEMNSMSETADDREAIPTATDRASRLERMTKAGPLP